MKKSAVTRKETADFLFALVGGEALSEKQRDAPDCGKADQCIDDTADSGGLSAKKICNHIKTEQAYTAPVETADDGKDKGNAIHNHLLSLL